MMTYVSPCYQSTVILLSIALFYAILSMLAGSRGWMEGSMTGIRYVSKVTNYKKNISLHRS